MGVKVAKHGNRSVSSKVGSADLIEAFGIHFDDSIEGAIESINNQNLSFLYAPNFHKSMKNVAHIRKELKTRTIFNILGPLVNPLRPKKQLLGVYDKNLMIPVANALIKQGTEKALVVHGAMEWMRFLIARILILQKWITAKLKNIKFIQMILVTHLVMKMPILS